MFNVPQSKINEWKKAFKVHQLLIANSEIYFHTIALINKRHTIMTRPDFVQYYKIFTSDIELQSEPMDMFIPLDGSEEEEIEKTTNEETNVDEVLEKLKKPNRSFRCNRLSPEYARIKNRVTSEELHKTLEATHPVIMALDNHQVTLDDVLDDIFIYYSIYKYLERIGEFRIKEFANFSDAIEYVVENIRLDELKDFIKRGEKVDDKKVDKLADYVFFETDYNSICDFYEKEYEPSFRLDLLLDKLITNIVLKSDIYIILAIYLAASFAVSDFKRGIESPCVNYVREVLSCI